MISNELSKLPTINFYGSLYIPNLSSLDNEEDAIELHNGGMPPRMTDEERKQQNEKKQIDINDKIRRLEQVVEDLSTKEQNLLSKKKEIQDNEKISKEAKEKLIQAIPKSELYTEKDSKRKTETESKLKKLKMDLEQLKMELEQLDATIKASIRLKEATAKTEAIEKDEQELKSEVERLRKICDENIITPFTIIIDEAARLNKNLEATINIGGNDTKVEDILETIIATANIKISRHRENTEKPSKEEEADKETKREKELKELKSKGKKLDQYHEKMYIRGYENAKKVTDVNEYVRIFGDVYDERGNFTRKLNDGLNGIQALSRPLITTDDPTDKGQCWFFFRNKEEAHLSKTNKSMFHLTVH
jgi:DNA repair exonuclease SbcCD ATPase subunit